MNYTPEMTEAIVEAYKANPTKETVIQLAEQYNKPVKSIIGKLSKEGVYRREVYKTKLGMDPVTKVEMLEHIADLLECDSRLLNGLEKASKMSLINLQKVLESE